jgi:uncharacterized damage-inducible protein DinB
MSRIATFKHELDQESQITRKMLERVPNDKWDWKPHPKSMNIRQLTTHIAELPTWITLGLTTEELDFATAPYEPKEVNDTAALMDIFEDSLANGYAELKEANEAKMDEPWVLRNGDSVLFSTTKEGVARMAMNQVTHHRAQLGVFLRLLDVPIPGSYGPSADEPGF